VGKPGTPEPLTKTEAQQLARALLDAGRYVIVHHCALEAAKDRLNAVDLVNAVRHGQAHKHEKQTDGTNSYKFTRRDVGAAITFRWRDGGAYEFFFRSAWRMRRRRD
jgi:hypothetical protein